MGFPPTEEQQLIIDDAVEGRKIWVNAGAGTGKTSTLHHIARALPNVRMTYLAFNSAIKQEASTKFPANVKCYTTHGLALRTNFAEWQRKMRLKGGSKRGRDIAQRARIHSGYRSENTDLSAADIGALAWAMVERYCSSADPEIGWWHLSKSHVDGVDDDERRHLGRLIGRYAEAIWADLRSSEHPAYPFGHSHYRKAWALTNPIIPADVILFDEAQDTAPVVMGVLLQQTHAMVIPVGDRYQAINGFTGAVDALDRFDGTERRLTQSFRFGPAVADVANQFLDALGTDMRVKGYSKIQSVIGECPQPDAILCRTNSGAMTEVFKALDAGKRVALQGDGTEIQALATAALQLQAGIRPEHRDLRTFSNWGEVQDYVENEPAGADLKAFVGLVDREGAQEILYALNGLVKTRPSGQQRQSSGQRGSKPAPPVKADVIVSTAHKAKGLEFATVRTADDFPSAKSENDTTGAKQLNPDELMLAYVAATRAVKKLDPAGIMAVLS